MRKRRRKCYYSGIRYGGRGCQGKSSDHQRCSIQACTGMKLCCTDDFVKLLRINIFTKNFLNAICCVVEDEFFNYTNYTV